ncbi:WD domain, G-beta repeat containing protein [Babesia divergens]|uniref:WD domain, G-beta repeat containing protein n=1 Tax=Babesia divergens TaxID=32595 RepID=A0AAD9GA47_BABDI|nr:WD domain, G-beta repeat containing protein [Babesia divergens]
MGSYVKLSQVEGLRESDTDVYECDRNVKRFFRSSKVVGSGKESAPVSHVAFSPTGSVVSICSGTKVIFYNYIDDAVIYTFNDSRDFVRCCSFRSDGKVAAVSDDGGWIQLIALELKSNLKKWRAHEAACHAHQFSCNKTKLMTGGDDGIAKFWDTITGEVLHEFRFHKDKIRTLSDVCGSEHLWVTCGYDSVGYVFDVRDHVKPISQVNHGAPIEFVELSTVKNLLLTVGGNVLKIWDLSNGLQLLHSFEPHQRTIVRGYIRDTLITASLDGTVRYFNCASIYQGDYASYDDKRLFTLPNAEHSNGKSSDESESPAASVSKVEFESCYDFRTPLDEAPPSCQKEVTFDAVENIIGKKSPLNIGDGDDSTFVTPQGTQSPSSDGPLSPAGIVKLHTEGEAHVPRNGFESARSNIASPRRVNKANVPDIANPGAPDEREFSLRHVYRFSDSVTAFAVSLDGKSIAVGLSSGEWLLRHNARTLCESDPQPKKVLKVADNVVEYKSVKLSLLDRLVKTFQYQAALDLSLSLTPDHVFNLVETLILRGSLATAVRGKDEQTILPLLRFLSNHLGNDIINTNSLLELAHAVLDNNQWLECCDNIQVIEELRKIPSKINFELFQHNVLQSLKGSLDLILSRPNQVGEFNL